MGMLFFGQSAKVLRMGNIHVDKDIGKWTLIHLWKTDRYKF